MHLRAIGSGLRYVGEYLPGKHAPLDVIGPCKPVGPFELIILSGEYITISLLKYTDCQHCSSLKKNNVIN